MMSLNTVDKLQYIPITNTHNRKWVDSQFPQATKCVCHPLSIKNWMMSGKMLTSLSLTGILVKWLTLMW